MIGEAERVRVRSVLDNSLTNYALNVSLLVALFLPDCWAALDISDEWVLWARSPPRPRLSAETLLFRAWSPVLAT